MLLPWRLNLPMDTSVSEAEIKNRDRLSGDYTGGRARTVIGYPSWHGACEDLPE